MKNSLFAKTTFEQGFNCAQSILFTYGMGFFKEDSAALRLASGFGAGISYRGELCGAVSASLMIIGLNYGYSDLKPDNSKELTLKITREFLESFESRFGSVICNRLLKTEINTTEGLEFARRNDIFKKTCPILVEGASEILETLLQKYSK